MEPPTPGSLDLPDLGSALHEVFTPEMREKMVRLEKENEILRRRLAEPGDSSGGGVVTVRGGGGVVTVRGGGGVVSVRGGEGVGGEISGSRRGGGGGGGGSDQAVVVLRRQLLEKEKRISQLETMTRENSEPTTRTNIFNNTHIYSILYMIDTHTHTQQTSCLR